FSQQAAGPFTPLPNQKGANPLQDLLPPIEKTWYTTDAAIHLFQATTNKNGTGRPFPFYNFKTKKNPTPPPATVKVPNFLAQTPESNGIIMDDVVDPALGWL